MCPKQSFAGNEIAGFPEITQDNQLVNIWSQSFLWASLIWGSIGSGYCLYGWKQRALIPFLGGLAMISVSCLFPALPMSLACILTMLIVWWLLRQGY